MPVLEYTTVFDADYFIWIEISSMGSRVGGDIISRNMRVVLYFPREVMIGDRSVNVIWVKLEPIRIVQVGEQVLLVELNIVLDEVLDICLIQYFRKLTYIVILSCQIYVVMVIVKLANVETVYGLKDQTT